MKTKKTPLNNKEFNLKKMVDMAVSSELRRLICNPDWNVSLEDILDGIKIEFTQVILYMKN